MSILRIAVSQFPVSENIRKNEAYILRHLLTAAEKNADIVHFPETALSGYATRPEDIDWDLLGKSLRRIQECAREQQLYVVLGAHQQRTDGENPLNCSFLISPSGQVLGSYNKTQLYQGETDRFSSHPDFLVQAIKGIRCGFLICYDSCFPELFQRYRDQGVQILFLSYCNAQSRQGKNVLDALMEAQLRTRAADHMLYISASNSSARYSRMPSGVASPDGELKKLKRHAAGILIYDYPKSPLEWTYDNRQ